MNSEYVLSGPRGFANVNKCPLAHIIFDSLRQNSKRTALVNVSTGESVTYKDILKKSLAFMTAFRELGIKKGDIICFIVENHINYFIPFTSALFSGITSHLINPDFLTYELNHAIQISKPKLIIASNYTLEKALYLRSKYEFVKSIINLDPCDLEDIYEMNNLMKLYENHTQEKIEEFDDANQEAIIINSSGTTGLPKGVILTHLNLKYIINYSLEDQYFKNTMDDVLLLYLPNFHIFGVLLFISMIVPGSKGIVFPKFTLTKLLESVQKYKVQKLFLVPPILVLLTKEQLTEAYDLSSLKHAFCGAAPLGPEVEKKFEDRFGFKVRQVYGLSELTGIITVVSPSNSTKESTVGKLNPGCSAKVVDVVTGLSLPPFESGELCFKGPMVMKGYYKNPKATKEIIDTDGFLHTGDLGYYDKNGNFYIVDRLKDIIKYKAWQVSPAEIEDLLKSHEDIKDAAVIGIPDEMAGEVAMALIVKQTNSKITDKEIIKFVADNATVPKRLHGGVFFVDVIPKNASGKIIRKLLREQINTLRHDDSK